MQPLNHRRIGTLAGPTTYLLLSAAILALAVLLRLHDLGTRSLWFDEAMYANNSYVRSFSALLANTRTYNSSPILLPYLYFLLGNTARTPFWIRVPPMLFSLGAVVVALALPRTGVRRSVAVITALLLAVSASQVFYAQEVREYSLSVLAAILILAGFIRAHDKVWPRGLLLLTFAVCLAPLASYGDCFLVLAVFAVGGLEMLCRPRADRALAQALIPPGAFLGAAIVTYALTARYQMGITTAGYLARHYPPSHPLALLKWLSVEGIHYTAFLMGGILPAAVGGVLIVAHVWGRTAALSRGGSDWRRILESLRLEAVLVVLIAGLLLASLLRLYPFGGIRQQLFAAPLLCLCAARAFVWVNDLLPKRRRQLIWSVVLLAFLASTARSIPRVYGEIEDIQSAVRDNLANVKDGAVYAAYTAVPALRFHFPGRHFHYGSILPGHPQAIAKQAYGSVSGCKFYVVYSHIVRHEAARVNAALERMGARLDDEARYKDAEVASFVRC